MQHAPDIDAVVALEVENQAGEPRQGPKPQTRQVQFVGVSRRTRGGLSTDTGAGLTKGRDEVEVRLESTFARVMIDGFVNVPVSFAGCRLMRSTPGTMVDAFTQSSEVRGIRRYRRFGICAVEQQSAQMQPILILADQLTHIFAAAPQPQRATCSSTKDLSESGREMFIVRRMPEAPARLGEMDLRLNRSVTAPDTAHKPPRA